MAKQREELSCKISNLQLAQCKQLKLEEKGGLVAAAAQGEMERQKDGGWVLAQQPPLFFRLFITQPQLCWFCWA